ncbi:MAG TPA: hypothetical protein VEJ21_04230 [Acidimicrobiales bacterium]|nr:hypothetical protein [Acidimicrobiales bacterium]
MAATKPDDTQTEGFTDAQRSELSSMIAEAVKGAIGTPKREDKPLPQPPGPTDDEWAKMGPAQREASWKSAVENALASITHDADFEDLRRAVEELRNKPEPEKAPDVFSRLRAFLWGPEPEKTK